LKTIGPSLKSLSLCICGKSFYSISMTLALECGLLTHYAVLALLRNRNTVINDT